MDDKKKLIVGASVGIAGVIICGAIGMKMVFGTTLNVKDEVHVEVGEKVVLEPELFTDSTMSSSDISKVNISTKLTKDGEKYQYNPSTKEVTSRGKKYLEVGTYEVILKAGNKEEKSKLIVEDTTAPVITEKGSDHRTPVGTESFDYTSMVDIADYSDFDVDIASSAVDLNKEGSYKVTYSAKDEYGNMSTLDVVLNVGDQGYVTIDPVQDTNRYENLENDTTPVEDSSELSWKDKYKKDKLGMDIESDDDYEDEGDDDNTQGDGSGAFGKVKEKTFDSQEEAQKWIDKHIMGKGYVTWTIETTSDGKQKYNFSYDQD